VVRKTLDAGKYRVKGTVRNKDDPKKIEFLNGVYGEDLQKIELVEADLLVYESLKKAVEGRIRLFFVLISRMRLCDSCGITIQRRRLR
jgi:uncharacterized protein YbjT (DUF2867 family)